MKLYVAGPMSGYPEHNFPAFRKAAETLRSMSHEVSSPVEMDESSGFNGATAPNVTAGSAEWAKFLARDIMVIASPVVEAIVVLDGWEQSQGAALEVHVARELGKNVYRIAHGQDGELIHCYLETVKTGPKHQPSSDDSILDEAARLVGADRGDDYGHPGDDFARTAGAWRALFGWDVTPAQVALAMVVVKLSRLYETPDKRDSIVDIAGYARTYEMVIERNAQPNSCDWTPPTTW